LKNRVKVGLVYYSKTGHTKSVIEDIAQNILKDEHDTVLLPLELASPWHASADRLPLKELPQVQQFDKLVLGTPVHGGRMSAAMHTFLEDSEGLSGKQVIFLLTHLFWQGWGLNKL
jgi:flavodoxin